MSKYTLLFGDSFIGTFKLFNMPKWYIKKYKGGTMKGLSKPDNENRKDIINTINKYDPEKINAIIFCFGTVDIQFSFYYNKLMGNPFDMKEIVSGYIDFIQSVTEPDLYNVIVIFPYISPIKKDEYILMQLYKYHILDNFLYNTTNNDIYNYDSMRYKSLKKIYVKLKPFFKQEKRTNRLIKFNNYLSNYIEKTSIIPIDMNKYIINANGKLKLKYLAPNPWNIHFRWEPQIPNILKEFSPYGLSYRYLLSKSKLKKEEEKYLEDKKVVVNQFFPKFKKLLNYITRTTSSISMRKVKSGA